METLKGFLWKVSLKILNSGLILKTFTHVYMTGKIFFITLAGNMLIPLMDQIIFIPLNTLEIYFINAYYNNKRAKWP